jgi:hypothetical protein
MHKPTYLSHRRRRRVSKLELIGLIAIIKFTGIAAVTVAVRELRGARVALGTPSAAAFYSDHSVQIGSWGTDINPAPDLIAWRQNGPLLIHNNMLAQRLTALEWRLGKYAG